MIQPETAESLQKSLAVATASGGFFEMLATNSNAITVIAVVATGLASIVFGYINATANRERNRINKRDIVDSIVHDLHKAGKSESDIIEILAVINK